MRMFDIPAKWNAFGWAVKVIDGHDMTSIVEAIDWMDSIQDKPAVVIAKLSKEREFHSWRIILHSMERHRLTNSCSSIVRIGG